MDASGFHTLASHFPDRTVVTYDPRGLGRRSRKDEEFTDDYLAQPAPDPAMFGMSTEDDGARDDPLLSELSWAVSDYFPDVNALAAAPTHVGFLGGEFGDAGQPEAFARTLRGVLDHNA